MNGHRLAAAAALMLVLSAPALAAEPDWKKVDEALGRQGAMQPGGVYKFSFPRSDLKVTLDGVPVKPALALGSWVAFTGNGDHATVMGDLVLTEDEIAPVMKQLVQDGLEVTAVHNHILRASPATLYMHIGGMGDPAKLGKAIHGALAKSKTPLEAAPTSSTRTSVSTRRHWSRRSGRRGRRLAASTSSASRAPRQSRRTTWPCRPRWGRRSPSTSSPPVLAATTGDFVLLPEEVAPVLRTPSRTADRPPHPHAQRAASALLHALLGGRSAGEAGHRAQGGA